MKSLFACLFSTLLAITPSLTRASDDRDHTRAYRDVATGRKGDQLKVESFQPARQAWLKYGEKLHVRVNYLLRSDSSCYFVFQPYTDGKPTPNSDPIRTERFVKRDWVLVGAFNFFEPTRVDQVHITMYGDERINGNTRVINTLVTLKVDVDARWYDAAEQSRDHAQSGGSRDHTQSGGESSETARQVASNRYGDRLELVNLEPAWWGWMKSGEKLKVRVRYRLQSESSCKIFFTPYTDGSPTSGAHTHTPIRVQRGEENTWGGFYFNQSTHVEQVRVTMIGEDDRTLVTLIVSVDLRWP